MVLFFFRACFDTKMQIAYVAHKAPVIWPTKHSFAYLLLALLRGRGCSWKDSIEHLQPYTLTDLTALTRLQPYSPYTLTRLQPLKPYSPYNITAVTPLLNIVVTSENKEYVL